MKNSTVYDEQTTVVLDSYSITKTDKKYVLFVDVNESVSNALATQFPKCKVSTLGQETELTDRDLFMVPQQSICMAVISQPRSATELYRVIDIVSNSIDVGGMIVILSAGSSVRNRTRFEVSETWLGCRDGTWGVHRPSDTVVMKREA